MRTVLLQEIVEASGAVAATRSRKAKVEVLARTLGQAHPEHVEVVAAYLSGTLLQRRTGLGWRSLGALPSPAVEPTLDVAEVNRAFQEIADLSGPGSQGARAAAVAQLFSRATDPEQQWLRAVALGEVRQGALDSLLQEAVAAAAGLPVAAVRRAAMLSGSTIAVVALALRDGLAALESVGLAVGSPILPMLASSAPDVAAALERIGGRVVPAAEEVPEGVVEPGRTPVAVDAKLDGIRIQVHRAEDEVRIFTRSLEEITARLPEVVAAVRALPASRLVLDGEALLVDGDGRPRAFQETASRVATAGGELHVTSYFFDLLHLDGEDLLDRPAHVRWARLEALVPESQRVARLVTGDPAAAAGFLARVLEAGHEGVVVKDLAAAYDAGRRGAAWVKVKPVHTLDLVVLAVEWGSGRRQGLLSNIHLGARDPATGDFVMLGKTFKGMTDEVLTWQTERFLELETRREGHVVHVRPEQVVEIALDGLQRSSRYPGGVALRFARVVRYRDDKSAAEADTLETVLAISGG